MSRVLRLALNGGKPLLRAQDRLLREKPNAWIRAIFGGWGSGKTRGAALAFLDNCIANPWHGEYGDEDRPFSIIIAKTHKVLKDSSYREFKSVCPRELIRREWKSPEWKLELVNGHVVLFRTWKGSIEGLSACTVWIDEAHQIDSREQYLNYQMRAREPRARRLRVIISGLPESGWLRETFDGRDGDPERLVVKARSADNIYVDEAVRRQFRASLSRRDAVKYLEGEWIAPENAIYYDYDPTRHLVNDAGDRRQFVHLSIDVGERAAALFFQERVRRLRDERGGSYTDKGLHVVDELTPDNMSMAKILRLVTARGWKVDESKSLLFVDPATDRDEIAAVREVWPDIAIIRKERADRAYAIEYGIRCVRAALMDADENVRLTVHRDLPRTDRSLITAIPKYRRGEDGRPVKDNVTDHILDTLRMAVAHLLPQKGHGIEVREQRDAA